VTNSAELLARARINHQRLPALPAAIRPKTPAEAYVVQDGLIDQLLAHYGGSVIGYKVACTNITTQRQLNVDVPFAGRLLSAFLFESPASVDASKFFMRVVVASPPSTWRKGSSIAAWIGITGAECADTSTGPFARIRCTRGRHARTVDGANPGQPGLR